MGSKFQGVDPSINFTFAPGTGTANKVLITLQVVDNDNVAVAEPYMLDVWLSEVASGKISTDAPSGAFDVASAGVLVYPLSATTSRHVRVCSDATGKVVLSLIDTAGGAGTLLYYVCAKDPRSGRTIVSAQMVVADFATA